jgi:membrane protease YdiL (CAAX protease family)
MIAFCVAFTATLLSFTRGQLVAETTRRIEGDQFRSELGWFASATFRDLVLLGFGLLLVASAPRRSGISLGTKEHRGKAIAICGFIIGGALAYRVFFQGGTFSDWQTGWSIWAISPLAQELVFSGFILGLLHQHFPRWWFASVPMTTAVAITAALFAMWHFIPDYIFAREDMSFIGFRIAYTAGGWLLYGISRLWTGTILYAVIMHIAVNFITVG